MNMRISKKHLKSAIDDALKDRRALNLNDYNATDWDVLGVATEHLNGLLNTATSLGWHDLENYALANL
jgi:hypothetical protein